jgi:hypothetical protein
VKKNTLTKAMLSTLLLFSSAVMAADQYPASDFKPKVVYSDTTGSSSSAKATAPVQVDPNYPATNYQPKVLFNDDSYKHSSAAPSIHSASSATSSTSEAVAATNDAATPASNNFLYGILALAAVGFFLYKQKAGCPTSKPATSSAATSRNTDGGSTGVEKYLQKQGINKTGVAKYLDKQGENPATGVAKYVAKQKIKDKIAAASRTTGVEKYLRNKA